MTLRHLQKSLMPRRSYLVVTIGKYMSQSTWQPLLLNKSRGGFVVWRAAQWYPNLVSHVFSVCTPYTPPHKQYFSTEDLVKGQLPQFAYQLHLASGEVEKSVKDEQSIRQFLRGMYGARGPNGELAFDPEKGVLAENLPKIEESRILNGKVRLKLFKATLHEDGEVAARHLPFRNYGSRPDHRDAWFQT
jgi:hypothetical protein